MQKLNFIILTFSLLALANCGAVQTTKSGYQIKGEISRTILMDSKLNGKCKVSGLVYSRNDSTFLSAANIIVNDNSGTTSNERGEFELELKPGTYNIRTNFVGHDDLTISELVLLPNQHAILIFQLGATAIY